MTETITKARNERTERTISVEAEGIERVIAVERDGIIAGAVYSDSYEVTPTGSAQYLDTAGKLLTQDIKVNPIPSNYGLITWNGSYLKVS